MLLVSGCECWPWSHAALLNVRHCCLDSENSHVDFGSHQVFSLLKIVCTWLKEPFPQLCSILLARFQYMVCRHWSEFLWEFGSQKDLSCRVPDSTEFLMKWHLISAVSCLVLSTQYRGIGVFLDIPVCCCCCCLTLGHFPVVQRVYCCSDSCSLAFSALGTLADHTWASSAILKNSSCGVYLLFNTYLKYFTMCIYLCIRNKINEFISNDQIIALTQ